METVSYLVSVVLNCTNSFSIFCHFRMVIPTAILPVCVLRACVKMPSHPCIGGTAALSLKFLLIFRPIESSLIGHN